MMKLSEMSIDKLIAFKEDPFINEEDQGYMQLIDMISKSGVKQTVTAFINEDKQVEVVTGKRIIEACRYLGIDTIPVVINDMTRDEATIIHIGEMLTVRDRVLPSEKAVAYKMLKEAYLHSGKKILDDGNEEMYTNKKISELAQESYVNINRYIHLNDLIPELLKLVDEGRIAIRPAVEISYLSEKLQQVIYDFYDTEEVTPSYAQAMKMKKMDKENNLDEEDIEKILSQEKANQKKSSINLSQEFCSTYFPKCRTRTDVENEILKLIRKLQSYEKSPGNNREEDMAI